MNTEPNIESEYADILQQVSGHLATLPKDHATLVECANMAGERWQRANYALSELERIDTIKIACAGFPEYATLISRARVLLDYPFAPMINIYREDL